MVHVYNLTYYLLIIDWCMTYYATPHSKLISLPCSVAALMLIKITLALLPVLLFRFSPLAPGPHTLSFLLAIASATDTFLGCPLGPPPRVPHPEANFTSLLLLPALGLVSVTAP